jgi:hypothetical protein
MPKPAGLLQGGHRLMSTESPLRRSADRVRHRASMGPSVGVDGKRSFEVLYRKLTTASSARHMVAPISGQGRDAIPRCCARARTGRCMHWSASLSSPKRNCRAGLAADHVLRLDIAVPAGRRMGRPTTRFNGAVDWCRRKGGRPRRWRGRPSASMGPSIGVDGKQVRRSVGTRRRVASMGPSIGVDGKETRYCARGLSWAASMGPSIGVDGKSRAANVTGAAEVLQWGRRLVSTERAYVSIDLTGRMSGFNGAVDWCRRKVRSRCGGEASLRSSVAETSASARPTAWLIASSISFEFSIPASWQTCADNRRTFRSLVGFRDGRPRAKTSSRERSHEAR